MFTLLISYIIKLDVFYFYILLYTSHFQCLKCKIKDKIVVLCLILNQNWMGSKRPAGTTSVNFANHIKLIKHVIIDSIPIIIVVIH